MAGSFVAPVPVGGVEVDALGEPADDVLDAVADACGAGAFFRACALVGSVEEAEDVQPQGVVGVDGERVEGALGCEAVAADLAGVAWMGMPWAVRAVMSR
ncbi:hypothetical protein [Streptomyces olivaceoviridis]|uniref:hypothetical protein n=1 Tax=Streptomyces olivaceoviridis TaxID=1921 RepID=UPI00167AE893|nr:hypothetical protein [Streptomyces olivaceoviridis]